MTAFDHQPAIETFEDAVSLDPTVNRIHKHGGPSPLVLMVVTLAREKQFLLRRLIELESIAPRKLVAKDGKVYVWHCPEDLIPTTEL